MFFNHFNYSLHDNVRVDSRGDCGRCVNSSQDISHFYFQNYLKGNDGDGRSVYRSQTRPYPSHHSGELGILLGVSISGQDKSGHLSQTSQFPSYNHFVIHIVYSRFSQETIPMYVQGEKIKNKHQGFVLYRVSIKLNSEVRVSKYPK